MASVVTNTPSSSLAAAPPIEWMRVPQAVQCFGPSRTKIYQLINDGKVRSVSLRDPGQTKATRLIHVGSLRAYIESFENKGG